MLDVERQLRDYFEDVTERVAADDVLVRVTTQRGVRLPERRLRFRPLAAGAIGFGLAMTLLGVVLVTDRLFGAKPGEATGGTGSLIDSGGGTSPWLVIPVAMGVALLIIGITFMRHTLNTQRGGEDMQTMEQIDTAERPLASENDALRKRVRGLGWFSGILAVAALALGAWLMVELSSSDGVDLPSEVQATMDGYLDGWNAHSGPDAMDFVTDDYTFDNGEEVFNRVTTAQMITGGAVTTFRVEVLDSIATGDGPYYVTSTGRWFVISEPEGLTGVSVYTVVNDGGTWKIQHHAWTGEIAS